ncbi:hypothetical protein ISS05_01440 [Candidatus Woesearchaeota archaeon]|nr:hypothetical protein [Candidatus Woesearchaeota archaeon]
MNKGIPRILIVTKEEKFSGFIKSIVEEDFGLATLLSDYDPMNVKSGIDDLKISGVILDQDPIHLGRNTHTYLENSGLPYCIIENELYDAIEKLIEGVKDSKETNKT